MTDWKYTLKFKHLFTNDPKESYEVSQKIAKQIEKFYQQNNNEDLYLEFKDLAEAFRDIENIGDVTGQVNTLLDELYDACDFHRVWTK